VHCLCRWSFREGPVDRILGILIGTRGSRFGSRKNSGMILRPGGRAEPAEAGGVASVWYQSRICLYISEEEEKKAEC
jgi:hypothetical protein